MGGDGAAELDLRVDLPVAHRGDAQPDRPVGEVHDVAGRDGGRQARPAQGQVVVVADFPGAALECQVLARLELDHALPQLADAQLGTGEVLEDRDLTAGTLGRGAHALRGLGVRLARAVGEVEPRHVHSGRDHPLERGDIARGGPDGGDDLGAAHALTVAGGLWRNGYGACSSGKCSATCSRRTPRTQARSSTEAIR